MTTFDSTKRSLPELLKDITTGKIQLPDFQRGWVWGALPLGSLLFFIGAAVISSSWLPLSAGVTLALAGFVSAIVLLRCHGDA